MSETTFFIIRREYVEIRLVYIYLQGTKVVRPEVFQQEETFSSCRTEKIP